MIYITGDTHGDINRFLMLVHSIPNLPKMTPSLFAEILALFGLMRVTLLDLIKIMMSLTDYRTSHIQFCLLTAITKITIDCQSSPKLKNTAAPCTKSEKTFIILKEVGYTPLREKHSLLSAVHILLINI